MSTSYRFTLYVAGNGPRSEIAEARLRRLCGERLAPADFDITTVDVLTALDEAEAARILVTPTVIRVEPLPTVRVIGDLSATAMLAEALGIPEPNPD